MRPCQAHAGKALSSAEQSAPVLTWKENQNQRGVAREALRDHRSRYQTWPGLRCVCALFRCQQTVENQRPLRRLRGHHSKGLSTRLPAVSQETLKPVRTDRKSVV